VLLRATARFRPSRTLGKVARVLVTVMMMMMMMMMKMKIVECVQVQRRASQATTGCCCFARGPSAQPARARPAKRRSDAAVRRRSLSLVRAPSPRLRAPSHARRLERANA
jgi:hypothetical protein